MIMILLLLLLLLILLLIIIVMLNIIIRRSGWRSGATTGRCSTTRCPATGTSSCSPSSPWSIYLVRLNTQMCLVQFAYISLHTLVVVFIELGFKFSLVSRSTSSRTCAAWPGPSGGMSCYPWRQPPRRQQLIIIVSMIVMIIMII